MLDVHAITLGHVTNWKQNISSCARAMATKPGRLMTYGERNPSTKSHDPLKTWWCVVTWQIKRVKCSLWEDLWPWNLASWWLIVRWTQPWSHSSFWSPGHMRSCHKLKLKYFFLQKTCGHQNLQSGDISGDQVHNEIAWLWSRNHKMSRVKL